MNEDTKAVELLLEQFDTDNAIVRNVDLHRCTNSVTGGGTVVTELKMTVEVESFRDSFSMTVDVLGKDEFVDEFMELVR